MNIVSIYNKYIHNNKVRIYISGEGRYSERPSFIPKYHKYIKRRLRDLRPLRPKPQ